MEICQLNESIREGRLRLWYLRLMSVKKVLVIKLRAMGDTVITTASLNALKKQLPEGAEIHCLVPRPWSALLGEHPALKKLFHWEKSFKLFRLFYWGWKFRRENYDAVIALHAAGTTAFLARLTGAPIRSVHFHGMTDTNRFSTVEIPGKGEVKPIIERDLDALRAIGWGVETTPTSIFISQQLRGWASEFFKENHLQKPLLVLAPGASRPTKIWSTQRFRELAEKWMDEKCGSVLVILGPQEEKLSRPFQGLGNLYIRCGGSLLENAALIQQADLFIGNDSGPKHLAVALGVKTITLFGPESPYEWHPYSLEKHPVLYVENLSCRKSLKPGLPEWCSISECIVEKHRCMKGITAKQVSELWRQ